MDLVVKGGSLVVPNLGILKAGVAISKGKIVAITSDSNLPNADRVIDATGKYVFPGVVDPHVHIGFYQGFATDARSESACAVRGGVCTILSYHRGPEQYREGIQRLLESVRGSFYCDYGFHLGMLKWQHLDDLPIILEKLGICSFKYYMHYKGREEEFACDRPIDMGLFYDVVAELSKYVKANPKLRLSVHCEDPDIVAAATAKTRRQGIEGLKAYNLARPDTGEAVAVLAALQICRDFHVPLYIPHITSKKALDTITSFRQLNAEMDVVEETSIHYLMLTDDASVGILAKVNPPIRGAADREALWADLSAGRIKCVGSDHIAQKESVKRGKGNIWSANLGFAGTSMILPSLLSEGFHLRKVLGLIDISEITSYNPSLTFGLFPRKGSIAVGSDADVTIVDLNLKMKVDPEVQGSSSDFSVYQDLTLTGWPTATIVRGTVVYEEGQISSPPCGQYLSRPAVMLEN